MNKQRKAKIEDVHIQLVALKKQLKMIQDDEVDAFDSMPEGLQSSMRGEESEDAIDAMDQALDQIDEAISSLEDII